MIAYGSSFDQTDPNSWSDADRQYRMGWRCGIQMIGKNTGSYRSIPWNAWDEGINQREETRPPNWEDLKSRRSKCLIKLLDSTRPVAINFDGVGPDTERMREQDEALPAEVGPRRRPPRRRPPKNKRTVKGRH